MILKRVLCRLGLIAPLVALAASLALAQTQTPNLGLTKPAVGSLNWGPTINTDLDLVDAKLAAAYYYQASAGSGLNLNIAAGSAFCGNPPVAVTYAGGSLALTANQTNYVYLDPAATCVPAFNITGFAVGQIPLAKVVTGTSTITTVTDVRSWFVPLPCVMSATGAIQCSALGTDQNITLTHSGTATTVLGNSQVGIGGDGRIQVGTSFYNGPNNPTLTTAAEVSIIVENGIGYMWYTDPQGYIDLARATNSLFDDWITTDTHLLGETGVHYPYVFKSGSIYYLLGNHEFTGIGDIYMYSSTDKVNWTIANGGNPVLHHSAVGTDWNYRLFNTAAVMVGGTVHLVVEGATLADWDHYAMGYSYSTLPTPNFDTYLTMIKDTVGGRCTGSCPDLHYVPDRGSLMVFYGDCAEGVATPAPPGQPTYRMLAATGLLSADLTIPGNWPEAPNFEFAIPGFSVADYSFVDLTGLDKAHNLLVAYNYNQWTPPDGGTWQAYSDLTLDEFYDAITANTLFRIAARRTEFSGFEFNVFGPDMISPLMRCVNGYCNIAEYKPKTDTTPQMALLISSNEGIADYPFGLGITITGGATVADRLISLGTRDQGLDNGGTLVLQPSGGSVRVGGGSMAPSANQVEIVGASGGTTGLFLAGIAGISNGFTIVPDASNHLIYSMVTGTGSHGFYQDASGQVGIGKVPGDGAQLDVAKSAVFGLNVVTFSATPTFDASLGNTQKITLTDNVTSSTLSNATAGETINFIICQDATGSRTFVWPTNVLFPAGASTAIGATASKCSTLLTVFDGTNALVFGGLNINE